MRTFRVLCFLLLVIVLIAAVSCAQAVDSSWLWFLNGGTAPENTGRGVVLWYIGEYGSSFRQDLVPDEYLPANDKDVGYVIVVREGDSSLAGFYSNGADGLIRKLDIILYAAGTGVEISREGAYGSNPPETTTSSAMVVYGDWPEDEDVARVVARLCGLLSEDVPEASIWEYVVRKAGDEAEILETYSMTDPETCAYLQIEPGIEILGYNGYEGGSLRIPEEINGIPVTAIGRGAFRNKDGFNSITVPDTVTRIGEYSFAYTYMTTIVLPDTLTVLPYDSLACNIEGIHSFPQSLKAIGGYALSGCLFNWEILELPEGFERIENNAFTSVSNTPGVLLPRSLNYLGILAFYDSDSLTVQVHRDSYAHQLLEDDGWQALLEAYAEERGCAIEELDFCVRPQVEVVD